MSKRTVIAVVAAVAAFGAVSASAAGLGGLTGSNLGAETKVVAACDTNGVGVTYTTSYSTTGNQYVVTGVTLTGLDAACASTPASVTVAKTSATAAVLGSGSATTSTFTAGTTANTVAVSLTPTSPATVIAAKDIENIAVVIGS